MTVETGYMDPTNIIMFLLFFCVTGAMAVDPQLQKSQWNVLSLPLTGFRPGLGFGFRFSAAAWVSGFAHSAAGFRVSGFGLVGLHNQPGTRGRAPQDKFE